MLRRIVDFLNPWKRNDPNLLEYLELNEWYESLSEEEQRKLGKYSTVFGESDVGALLNQSISSTSQTQQSYLKSVGSRAARNEDYEFAEKVLLRALEAEDDNPNDRHFVYNTLIRMYYDQRDERADAIENCIKYCKEDIDHIDEFLSVLDQDSNIDHLPSIPSFKRLAIIYERQGKYRDAVEICEMALERGLTDGTKGGFEGRKQRLQSQIDDS
ncbi:tetratricopeptide repeat protein [Natronorubrum tibetense]|uniref:Tetratricopeptide repeat protein n=1 Tax=Natronorubrum tibetense GA33 TaxID=1114856 RepID=L9VRQ7_9EURY|nr:tetratricopeptide repeat protein [Natronorubrum tibetense]ELY39849.1 hypothetical protein C496_14266 [Natronorubrum tibetense GA33]